MRLPESAVPASQASMHKPCFSLSLKSTQGRSEHTWKTGMWWGVGRPAVDGEMEGAPLWRSPAPQMEGWRGRPSEGPHPQDSRFSLSGNSPAPPALKSRSCSWWTLFLPTSSFSWQDAFCTYVSHTHTQAHTQHLKQTCKPHAPPASTGRRTFTRTFRMSSVNSLTSSLVLSPWGDPCCLGLGQGKH